MTDEISTSLQHVLNRVRAEKGITYRVNRFLGIRVEDDTIFTQAATLYVLKSLSNSLLHEESAVVASIEELITPKYPEFRNKNGRFSYNFWRTTNIHSHFPNGKILHRFKFFRLPDDVDTTSMIALTSAVDDADKRRLKELLPLHANGYKLWVKNSHLLVKHLRAYSTWFGKDMPIELDVAVLSNLMLWVFEVELPLNENDLDVVELLERVVEMRLFYTDCFTVSPEYPRVVVVLYHLSRVMSLYPHRFKPFIINMLIEVLWVEFNKRKLGFEKMLLQSALLRFNQLEASGMVEVHKTEIENYWWFTAGFLSVYSWPLLKWMAPSPIFHQRFVSPVLNQALLIENRVLNRASRLKNVVIFNP